MQKKMIAAVLIMLIALTGCGTANTSNGSNGSNGSNSGNEGESPVIEEEELIVFQAELKNIEGLKYTLTLTLASDHEKEETLTFPSSQRFNYNLKDSDGEIMYHYAADKLFALVTEEKMVQPGEFVQYEIDLIEALPYIEAGTYTLEAWVTAEGVEDIIAASEFEYDGVMPTLKEKVEFNGQMDPHSIEVTTEEGELDFYQLAEDMQDKFSEIEPGTMLEVEYTLNEIGQKVIQSFETVE